MINPNEAPPLLIAVRSQNTACEPCKGCAYAPNCVDPDTSKCIAKTRNDGENVIFKRGPVREPRAVRILSDSELIGMLNAMELHARRQIAEACCEVEP